METIFFHFLRQKSTTASGSSFFFNWTIFFSQSFILASEYEFTVYWKQYFFYFKFFLLMENITKIWRKPNLQTNDIPASGHHFFYLFFQMFLKVEAVLSYSKSVLYPARANKFSVYGNNIFFIRAILLQLEINGVIKR